MPWPTEYRRPLPRPIRHCRDERIAATKEPLCRKTSKSSAELILNYCRNCGRPFDEEAAGA